MRETTDCGISAGTRLAVPFSTERLRGPVNRIACETREQKRGINDAACSVTWSWRCTARVIAWKTGTGAERGYIDRRRRQEEEWLDHLRDNETALRENRADPALLTEICGQIFSQIRSTIAVFRDPGISSRTWDEIHNLIAAVRQGIFGVVEREDIPDVEDILALKEEGRVYHIGWPFLSAMAEIGDSTPEKTQLPQ